MKMFIENLYLKSNKLLKVLSPLKKEHQETMHMHTKEPKFQKVECFDVNINKNGNNNNSTQRSDPYKFSFVKLEKEDPKMMTLTNNQKIVLVNYINKSFHDYYKGAIHLDDHTIVNFRNVQNAVEGNLQIRKSCVDFVLKDMRNSFTREGHSNLLNSHVDCDDVMDMRIRK